MKHVRLPRTELDVSRFIFGTASLFNAGTRTARPKAALSSKSWSHCQASEALGER